MQIAFYTQDDHLFRTIHAAFAEDGAYRCVRFTHELSLIRHLQRHPAALVLFDAGRTSAPGQAVLSWRACHFRSDLPVMMIGQSWDQHNVIEALDAGVDEIAVGTPCTKEILARARRTIARSSGSSKTVSRMTLGAYTIDRGERVVSTPGGNVQLTARELTLAWLLFTNAGSLLTRDQIAHAVWGKDAVIASRSIEQHIYKLRCKLSLDGEADLQLKTVYSLGYVLDRTPSAMASVTGALSGERAVAIGAL
jgi:DNA-binding response OmpR family regulator